ncbi:MAG TPA: 23S rRNA (adenine(1618)-N(6))-methyltransferase RlmF [Holophagaceae bacterium]|nr:23S rRNA (adenine(1618)-N(6))-methyltransferase RlmF [Holophagaceae bacterium]
MKPEPKPGLHPRNRHRGRYDFVALLKVCPELGPFLQDNPMGDRSIDFADPAAVKLLNRALLLQVYGIKDWDIPLGYLCPPIPGRADYLHHLADLLEGAKGAAVRVLDIGTGANVIYPLIGHHDYGWTFVGTEIDGTALESARRIVAANGLQEAIELRLQSNPAKVFEGVVKPGERFDACLCNPPFHASLVEAREGALRKWRNLGKDSGQKAPTLNFGGQGAELWCPGGELGFVERMIKESARIPETCRWFTALLSKSTNLPGVQRALRQAGAADTRVIPMAQGQKQSRLVAWMFSPPDPS